MSGRLPTGLHRQNRTPEKLHPFAEKRKEFCARESSRCKGGWQLENTCERGISKDPKQKRDDEQIS
jgi:hypothetical protein